MGIYAERDSMALDDAGGYHTRHVIAMTTEGLYAKADIAAELGLRDMHIDVLLEAVQKYEAAFNAMFAQCCSNGIFDAWGKPVSCLPLNDAHATSDRALKLVTGTDIEIPPAETSADMDETLQDHQRLVRELDVLLNGEEGAAQQASLCDIVAQVRKHGVVIKPLPDREDADICPKCNGEGSTECMMSLKGGRGGFGRVMCIRCFGKGTVPKGMQQWIEEGKALQLRRRSMGVSTYEAAQIKQTSSAYISAIEMGVKEPPAGSELWWTDEDPDL
ncbi:MAG: hypothetical protein ACRCUB_17975 [Plesiomonas shigelloides]